MTFARSKRFAPAVLLLAAGCATPGAVTSDYADGLRSGVAAARQQSQVEFAAANKLIRDQAVEWKVAQPSPILKQSQFPAAVTPEAARLWAGAFDILDAYAAALQALVDPGHAHATGEAIGALGRSLNGPTLDARIPPSVTAVFQTFAAALVQAQAEKSASAVMRRTDAAFGQVVGGMAVALGRKTGEPGSLYDSVESAWNDSILPGIETRYGALSPQDAEGRRRAIRAYLDAMDARDAQLAELGQLSQSLLALGEAHAAAARGQPGDAAFWIARIGGWLDDVKRRTEEAGGAPGGPPVRPGGHSR